MSFKVGMRLGLDCGGQRGCCHWVEDWMGWCEDSLSLSVCDKYCARDVEGSRVLLWKDFMSFLMIIACYMISGIAISGGRLVFSVSLGLYSRLNSDKLPLRYDLLYFHVSFCFT